VEICNQNLGFCGFFSDADLAVECLHTIRQDGDSSGSGYPEPASQGD